ncbi:chemotaxis protein CheA [Niastella caeni]|uniref:Chemotaxis protein CheA n=1 Tax=Niastella caeni TaxID=2569763 RepID=A0A4S8HYF3_9BACT|nr:chemotaxis protein CheA [Niastella caeni]THU40803.1 chemotaxis protein CheA [Niastella caeni]
MNPFEAKYTSEALELIADMEQGLLLLETHPDDVSLVQQVFRSLHTLKGNSAMMGFKVIADFTHHLEAIYEFVRAEKIKVTAPIINITLASLDHLSVLLNSNKQLSDANKQIHESLTTDILTIITNMGNDHRSIVACEGQAVDSHERISEAPKRKAIISGIRVPVERLDTMMSLVTELITLQAKLSVLTSEHPQPDLLAAAESLEKISTRIRDNAFSMCLVPVENMVTPFHRLVRDLASELHKEIDFITEGTETELDKNIMEGLQDPLMHLLRNSIDHGIEEPAVREQNGKPRHGRIVLRAYCAGAHVYLEIQDDGKGMNKEKIRSKAIKQGLIGENDVLSDKELLQLVFVPGFSTAEQITETSGRGVGMDVVKRRIADIKGQVAIHSTENAGTTVTIQLPITLSIIDGLLVKVNGADYVIPLSAVDICQELSSVQLLNTFSNTIVIDDQVIPFINLQHELAGQASSMPGKEIVVVQYSEKKIGLLVDIIAGKFQAVLKPLGQYFNHLDIVTGATILGDGNIALVLDTNNVIEQFFNKKTGRYELTAAS